MDPFSFYDYLYMLDIVFPFFETLHVSSHCIKQKLTNENSATLWHKRLGYISKQWLEQIV